MNKAISVRSVTWEPLSEFALSYYKFCQKTLLVLIAGSMGFSLNLHAQTLNLVGNKAATYIDEHELPSRQMDLVSAALKDWPSKITATTQAWSGSGLKSGKFSGYIDHYSLNQTKDDFVYSAPFLQMHLHIVSKYKSAVDIIRLEQINGERVGVENRFANTDQLRPERDVRWGRVSSFFDNMKQLAEERVDYVLVDKAMIDEMNLLLLSVGEKPVYISRVPLIKVDVSLALNIAYKDAAKVISAFDAGIVTLKESGSYAELMKSDLNRESLLDKRIYTEMLRKW